MVSKKGKETVIIYPDDNFSDNEMKNIGNISHDGKDKSNTRTQSIVR